MDKSEIAYNAEKCRLKAVVTSDECYGWAGAGCMVLAFADVLQKAGWPPHRYLWVSATDIDPLAAGMAYIQLSLCGIAGEVVVGNTLVNERRRILYTPGHYLGGWPVRLSSRHFQAA